MQFDNAGAEQVTDEPTWLVLLMDSVVLTVATLAVFGLAFVVSIVISSITRAAPLDKPPASSSSSETGPAVPLFSFPIPYDASVTQYEDAKHAYVTRYYVRREQ